MLSIYNPPLNSTTVTPAPIMCYDDDKRQTVASVGYVYLQPIEINTNLDI